MKTTIKLVLIYFAFQIAAQILGIFYAIIYSLVETGKINMDITGSVAITPSLFLGILFMTVYLWKAGYISKEKITWSIVSPLYIILTVVICAAAIIVLDFLLSYMDWLPNLLESSFENLLSNWVGILSIAVFGPILEELLFRGAITRALLDRYNPTKAIIISALVFGIYHMNPIQIVSATLIGLLLGWIYYKTASLIPCILIHILNNSLSVWLTMKYPGVEYTRELIPGSEYFLIVSIAVVVFLGAFYLMNKTEIPYPWKNPRISGQTETLK